jgi:predicted negative regulator of RcsB-dependent stress response
VFYLFIQGKNVPALQTDREQIELIKNWWREYGKYVTVAIVVGVLLGLGWQFWHQQQNKMRVQASMLYQQLLAAASQQKNDAVKQISAEITKRYPQMEYASLANLMAAKSLMSERQEEPAFQKLKWVMDHSQLASFQQIARIHAARIRLAQKNDKEALNLLNTVNDKAFQPLIDEVKGDIYLSQGNNAQARQAYLNAQQGLSSALGEDLLLSLKLSNE